MGRMEERPVMSATYHPPHEKAPKENERVHAAMAQALSEMRIASENPVHYCRILNMAREVIGMEHAAAMDAARARATGKTTCPECLGTKFHVDGNRHCARCLGKGWHG